MPASGGAKPAQNVNNPPLSMLGKGNQSVTETDGGHHHERHTKQYRVCVSYDSIAPLPKRRGQSFITQSLHCTGTWNLLVNINRLYVQLTSIMFQSRQVATNYNNPQLTFPVKDFPVKVRKVYGASNDLCF